MRLALKANPNVLEVLYSPIVEHASPLAANLLAHRRIFVAALNDLLLRVRLKETSPKAPPKSPPNGPPNTPQNASPGGSQTRPPA